MHSQSTSDPSWMEIPKALEGPRGIKEVSVFGGVQEREDGGLAW